MSIKWNFPIISKETINKLTDDEQIELWKYYALQRINTTVDVMHDIFGKDNLDDLLLNKKIDVLRKHFIHNDNDK